MRTILLVVLATLVGGCASGYSQFFTRILGATPEAVAARRVAPAPAQPAIQRSDATMGAIVEAYERQGYSVIGYSSFTSGHAVSEAGALKQGAAIGADLVVVASPKYAGSITTTIPITTPTTQTSYTNGTATAYGTGGTASVYGSSTTTTYGSETNYVPMTIRREAFGAVYFVKQRFAFGAFLRDLTNEERQKYQSNSGVYVMTIVNGTPAFSSNVLVGDVILAVDGQSAGTQQGYVDLLSSHKGQTVQLTIARGAGVIQKSVTLGR